VPGEIEIVGEAVQNVLVGNRTLDELDTGVSGDVLSFGREEVIHHDERGDSLVEQPTDEVGTDESSAADDQRMLAAEARLARLRGAQVFSSIGLR
jgi:hypothetical protein